MASEVPPASGPVDIVVLVSGSGTLLQALIDAAGDPAYGVRIAAVGSDRPCSGLDRAERAGIPLFICAPAEFPSRGEWDAALAERLREVRPRFVVSAGFMRILGERVLSEQTVINTHPALLPSFPGAHGVRDALAYGVKVTGTTCHLVDAGIDTGPVIDQRVVAVAEDDTEESLHERIKVQERAMLVDVVRRLAHGGFTVEGHRVRLGPPSSSVQ
ncbi:MAG TPA: phosphoribosylglycinamide formyltransferase [Intrasporangium sp.]|uniref:phosphoribosylglycinamide formyltransferase n=1 Tax=Intrasporangium sp. TaxID=1925024 RepID=UPI002B483847|nr:phosphoribosylglycinamide formyltransferase [Intrasporangium sp.]HKX65951.1 phosphoribosylglycinamide formyltransferase [Intrasporangium sp.]